MKRRKAHPGPRANPPAPAEGSPPDWLRSEYLPTLHELTWLCTPQARSVCEAMNTDHPADTPTAIQRWRERLEPELVTAAWNQVLLRRAARSKFSRPGEMLLDRVGLEQSTDEVVASHKATRFAGCGRIADLCCGIGGDSLALAAHAPVLAVDISGPRAMMAEHNVGAYGRRAEGIIGDVELTHPDADAAHLDPDRRPEGRREHQVENSSPDLPVVQALVDRYHHVAIKLSPGAAFDRLPFEAEIELISHHGSCRQAVAWTGRFRTARRRATVLPGPHSLLAEDEVSLAWPPPRLAEPGLYLHEPDPAVIRADLVGVLARRIDSRPVDPHIAWLIGNQPANTPFAHVFRILDTIGFNEKKLRPWLAAHDVGSVDIKTRGVAFTPEELARRLRPAGTRPAILFITRLEDSPVAILAERLGR